MTAVPPPLPRVTRAVSPVRLLVTRGRGTLGLDAHLCSNPQVIIITDFIALYPAEFYEKGLEIVTASTLRNHPAALNPRIKSLNYLNNVLAKIEGAPDNAVRNWGRSRLGSCRHSGKCGPPRLDRYGATRVLKQIGEHPWNSAANQRIVEELLGQ